MPYVTSYHALLALQFFSNAYASPVGGPGVPVQGAKPATSPEAAKTIVTTAINSGSTYTLTYAPSTLTAGLVVTEASTTSSINAGAVVGVLAGGAAIAGALAFAPKFVPEPVPAGGGGEGENPSCQKKTAAICTQECENDWFISNCKIQTTSSYKLKSCSTTTGCAVVPSATTISHDAPKASVSKNPTDVGPDPTADPVAPNDMAKVQAHLAKEYFRLGIDDTDQPASDTKAKCATDGSKGVLQVSEVKKNIESYCNDHDGGTASPNSGILRTYDQVENRMQAVLQVTYTGDRRQGAIYTLRKDTCNSAFTEIAKCQSNGDNKLIGGGTYTVGTGVFSLQPYTYVGDLTCAANPTVGLQQAEATDNIATFCKKYDGKKISQGDNEKKEQYFQTTGGNLNTIKVNWASQNKGCNSNDYTINEASIYLPQKTHHLSEPNELTPTTSLEHRQHSVNDCNKDKPAFKAGGTVNDQCATYSLTPTTREELTCASDPRYSKEESDHAQPFDADTALTVINDFCGKDLLADPSVKDQKGGFSQDGNWPKGIARGGAKGVGIMVTFLPGCKPPDTPKSSSFKTGGPDCHRILKDTILDKCDTNPGQKKRGGSLVSAGINGCVQWQLLSQKA